MRHDRAALDGFLDGGGGHVLAACSDDEVLLAAGDVQEPVHVQASQVAGGEPSVGGEGILRRLGVLVIAVEHAASLQLDLAFFGKPHRESGERHAHTAGAERRAQRGERARGGRLGQAVALVDGDAGAAVERQKLRVERSAAAHKPLDTTAQCLLELRIDERLVQRTVCREHRTRLAMAHGLLHVFARRVDGGGEHIALRAVAGLLRCGVVHLLKHAGHDDERGGLGNLQVADERLDAGGDVDVHAGAHDAVVDGARERVRLGQEHEDGAVRVVDDVRHERLQVVCQLQVMLMRHLHALGRGGGAGRIHDGAQVGLVHLRDAFVEHAVADRVAVGAQGV